MVILWIFQAYSIIFTPKFYILINGKPNPKDLGTVTTPKTEFPNFILFKRKKLFKDKGSQMDLKMFVAEIKEMIKVRWKSVEKSRTQFQNMEKLGI